MTIEGEPDVRRQGVVEATERQLAVVDALLEKVKGADDTGSCLALMAGQRQANAYLRHLQPRLAAGSTRRSPLYPLLLEAERELLHRHELATEQIARYDEGIRAQARPDLGIRLAVIGKGGAGKTFISSTLARLLARRGRRVLAIDMDTNPGLSVSLGLPPIDAGLPVEALEERPGSMYGWRLATGLSPAVAVDRYSVEAPDGVRFLGLGKIGTVDKSAAKRSVEAILQIALGFGCPGWDVIADLEAGPTTPFERYHAFADDVAVIVGPAWRSAMMARRLLPLIGPCRTMVVANRFRDELAHPDPAPLVRIPFDREVTAAEAAGRAPMDECPDAPGIQAVNEFLQRYLIEEATA